MGHPIFRLVGGVEPLFILIWRVGGYTLVNPELLDRLEVTLICPTGLDTYLHFCFALEIR